MLFCSLALHAFQYMRKLLSLDACVYPSNRKLVGRTHSCVLSVWLELHAILFPWLQTYRTLRCHDLQDVLVGHSAIQFDLFGVLVGVLTGFLCVVR